MKWDQESGFCPNCGASITPQEFIKDTHVCVRKES